MERGAWQAPVHRGKKESNLTKELAHTALKGVLEVSLNLILPKHPYPHQPLLSEST